MISHHLLDQLQTTIHLHLASFYERKYLKKIRGEMLMNKLLNLN